MLVLDNGDGGFYTVELLAANGLNDHLPADGIAIHSVHIIDGALEPMTPEIGSPPYLALLQPTTRYLLDGWELSVSDDWTVTAHRASSP